MPMKLKNLNSSHSKGQVEIGKAKIAPCNVNNYITTKLHIV